MGELTCSADFLDKVNFRGKNRLRLGVLNAGLHNVRKFGHRLHLLLVKGVQLGGHLALAVIHFREALFSILNLRNYRLETPLHQLNSRLSIFECRPDVALHPSRFSNLLNLQLVLFNLILQKVHLLGKLRQLRVHLIHLRLVDNHIEESLLSKRVNLSGLGVVIARHDDDVHALRGENPSKVRMIHQLLNLVLRLVVS